MQKKNPTDNGSQLGNLLERYRRHIKPPQASVVKECIEVITLLTSMELNSNQVAYTVSTRTLVIKAPSIVRSELKRHHPVILSELQNRLGAKNAPLTII